LKMSVKESSLRDLIKAHKDFWRMKNPKPLLRVKRYSPLRSDVKIPLSDGRSVSDNVALDPDLIDPKLFIQRLDEYRKTSLITGDFIESLAPYDLCWTQAFIGCPIRVSSGKVWSEPFLKDITELKFSNLKVDRRWFNKLLEFTESLIEYSAGRYPIVQPLFRGPIDMAASALGPDKLCIAAYKHKEDLDLFLDFCAQTFIKALRAQADLIPRFHGGYSCMYGIWAPKPICRTQADHTVLISPKLYEKVFLPHDLTIIKAFDYTIFHLHSATIHIAEALVEIPELSAIQVSIDYPARAFSPSVKELLPILKKIHDNKPLILSGPVKEKEKRLILDELIPEGLALQLYILNR